MRICLLRAAPGHGDDPRYSDIGLFTDRHTFEQRFINEDTVKKDLNLVAAESFDLYFNFLHWAWCARNHQAAAVLAAKYIEYLNIPVIGVPSQILERCVLDEDNSFVVGNVNASATTSESKKDPTVDTETWYTCTTIELDNTPITLPPVSFHTTGELMTSSPSPLLSKEIYKLVEDAFYANDMHGTFWCTSFIRITATNKPILSGISPMSKTMFPFTASGRNLAAEAYTIRKFFPGSYRSLIHCLIASCCLKRNRGAETFRKVGREYDRLAPLYDKATVGIYADGVQTIIKKYNFDGVVLDLASGTGIVARLHGNPNNKTKFIGMDVSSQMRAECMKNRLYDSVILGPMQRLLITYNSPIDHIVCISAFHFLDINELYLVLSRVFQLARLSVTFTIDEIPKSYEKIQRDKSRDYMCGFNHSDEMDRYGAPVGWKLVDRWRYVGWKVPTAGAEEVYSNIFRFEAV
ncbi:hypothetical protein TWF481_012193 [Arthrobotrys musiformis]|uniref:Methyltransferase domain-containing protein n=1 Tax=Arthrobotrys musiformis TaxID=47236 RepID=A0AAV9VY54_9PEZI